jgi:polyhydroxyalkanoate synthesis repressor PhaR
VGLAPSLHCGNYRPERGRGTLGFVLSAEAGAVSEPRVIKKYPNRRLYDTTVSSYITLEDVRKLVLEQENFCVVDARSKEDITRSILLQIILEQEEDGEPIFSQQVLAQIIRFYGDALQGTLTRYLERSFGLFVEQQNALREQMQTMMTADPLSFMREMAEKNMALWKDMQDSFFRAGGGVGGPSAGGEGKGAGKAEGKTGSK